MRIFGFGLILMIAFAVLGIDISESWRAGTISDSAAHAKRHHRRHHKHARHRHRKHHRASEM
jgi:hypothetical protein